MIIYIFFFHSKQHCMYMWWIKTDFWKNCGGLFIYLLKHVYFFKSLSHLYWIKQNKKILQEYWSTYSEEGNKTTNQLNMIYRWKYVSVVKYRRRKSVFFGGMRSVIINRWMSKWLWAPAYPSSHKLVPHIY